MPPEESTGEEVQQTETDLSDSSTSTDQTSTEESTSSEQLSGSAESTDETPSFAGDNFDPKSLPDELVPAYKQMQGAFTKKTQAIAEERRSYEGLKRSADAYNVLMGNQDVKEHILDLLKGKQPERPPQEDLSKVDINAMTDQQLLEHQQKMMDQNTDRKLDERMAAIEPVQRQLLNNGISSMLGTIVHAMKEKYSDFDNYNQVIADNLAQINPATKNPVFVDLYLQGASVGQPHPLERAVENHYKQLAFDSLHSTIDQRANEKVQAKKKANLSTSSNTSRTTEKKADDSGKSLFETARDAWNRGMKERGVSSFEESQR